MDMCTHSYVDPYNIIVMSSNLIIVLQLRGAYQDDSETERYELSDW